MKNKYITERVWVVEGNRNSEHLLANSIEEACEMFRDIHPQDIVVKASFSLSFYRKPTKTITIDV